VIPDVSRRVRFDLRFIKLSTYLLVVVTHYVWPCWLVILRLEIRLCSLLSLEGRGMRGRYLVVMPAVFTLPVRRNSFSACCWGIFGLGKAWI
jgi:hypothetical protein